jgi:hypothetical protein
LTSSSRPCYEALLYHMVWLYNLALISFVTTQEKTLATSTLSLQND